MAKGFVAVRQRLSWPLILLLLLVHLIALYGLARLLVPDVTRSVEESVASVFTVTITAPETPDDNQPVPDEGAQGEAGQEATPSEVIAPTPEVVTTPPEPLPQASSTGTEVDSGATDSGEGTGAAGSGPGTGSGLDGGGRGGAAVTRPSVRSGNLDTASDFPIPEGGRQSRFGKSVTVVFTVTTDGRATNCSIARTSVDSETTALVCGLVAQKIRFNPARDRNGNPVAARYGYRVDFRGR
jgi:protein TonB